jgi:dolichol-phosphate mannosyltransferase
LESGRHPARLALSGLFTRLVNLLSGNHIRYYNGAPLFRTWDVLRWHVEASGFGFQAEFVTRLLEMGWTYKEVGVSAQDRQAGKSRALSLRNWLSAGYSLFKIFARTTRTKLLFGGRRES